MVKEEKKLKLNSEEILNKVFSASYIGYDSLEVDDFLDSIIDDYVYIEKEMSILAKQNEVLERKISSLENANKLLEVELTKYKNRFDGISENTSVSSENIQYLKRINTLEKYLFEHGIDINKIK